MKAVPYIFEEQYDAIQSLGGNDLCAGCVSYIDNLSTYISILKSLGNISSPKYLVILVTQTFGRQRNSQVLEERCYLVI